MQARKPIAGPAGQTSAAGTGPGPAGPPGKSAGAGLLRGTGGVLTAAAGGLLGIAGFLGTFLRPTSDDWCMAWKTRDMGVLGMTSDFYLTQNGRITNAFLSGVVYSHGMLGPQVLSTVLIIALGLGLYLLAREMLGALDVRAPLAVLAPAVLVVEALLFLGGTRTYQMLWAPAVISHILPSVLGIWALLAAIRAARSPRRRPRQAALVGALVTGFAIGTLSEPFLAVSGLTAATAALLTLPRLPLALRLARTWYPFTWSTLYCAGLTAGLAVLYTSPGAAWRRAQRSPREFSARRLARDWVHIWDTILSQWAYLGAAAAGVLLGLALTLTSSQPQPPVTRRRGLPQPAARLLLILPIPVLILSSLAVAHGLRLGYGGNGWTYARTWTSFLIPYLATLTLYGALLGHWVGQRAHTPDKPRLPRAAALLAGTFTLAALAALIPAAQQLTSQTVTRALRWDAQDARIRDEVTEGAGSVTYEAMSIGSLAEPYFSRHEGKDWVAPCTAKYYQVQQIHKP
ncbi:hypothetical protein OG765_01785 [Streptomyces sp. NBC_00555]|uniref:DUF6056 family protein n=1 Tax=Streptomyces sp. NBC_00555 TaxID=2903662 RepID=UPI00225C05A6|nr:hypothetical protein [Streptomyces sp. NBC_00555]MCX5009722.1 hypothetical protein [Streptomyces sp. NBC_00555]